MHVAALSPERLADFPVRGPILTEMFARGESRPGWCFLASREDQAVAAIGFRGDVLAPGMVTAFGTQGERDSLAATLEIALPALRKQGVELILTEVETGQVQEGFLQAGFELLQERHPWRWESPWPAVKAPPKITFRNMEEMGEAAFLDALVLLFENTQDPLLCLQTRVWGGVLAAERALDDLKSRNAHAHWWQVCFSTGGEPAGLVCPYLEAPRTGTFGLLETIPGQAVEGRRPSPSQQADQLRTKKALLSKGTEVLQSRGVDEIFYAAPQEWRTPFQQTGEYRAGEPVYALKFDFGNSPDLY